MADRRNGNDDGAGAATLRLPRGPLASAVEPSVVEPPAGESSAGPSTSSPASSVSRGATLIVMEERAVGLAQALARCGCLVRPAMTGFEAIAMVGERLPFAVVVGPGDPERRKILTGALRLRFPALAIIAVVPLVELTAELAAMTHARLPWPLPPPTEVRRVLDELAARGVTPLPMPARVPRTRSLGGTPTLPASSPTSSPPGTPAPRLPRTTSQGGLIPVGSPTSTPPTAPAPTAPPAPSAAPVRLPRTLSREGVAAPPSPSSSSFAGAAAAGADGPTELPLVSVEGPTTGSFTRPGAVRSDEGPRTSPSGAHLASQGTDEEATLDLARPPSRRGPPGAPLVGEGPRSPAARRRGAAPESSSGDGADLQTRPDLRQPLSRAVLGHAPVRRDPREVARQLAGMVFSLDDAARFLDELARAGGAPPARVADHATVVRQVARLIAELQVGVDDLE